MLAGGIDLTNAALEERVALWPKKMKSKIARLWPLSCGLFLLLLAATSHASPIVFIATLTGPSESPPVASPGIGSAVVTFDLAAHFMEVQVTFSGLLGATTASHIHSPTAVPGTGVAGVATVTPSFPGFPLGVTSGTALAGSLAAGTAYLNIHSSSFPGGEIRGFLVAVPETLSTFGCLLGAVGLLALPRLRHLRGARDELGP